MNNLRKFTNEAEYTAATLNYPAVSWVTATDVVHFDKTAPAPSYNGDLSVTYYPLSTSSPTRLIYGEDGSGSGSGSAAFTPTRMWVDGVEVTPSTTYTFSDTNEHVVDFELGDGVTAIPINGFYNGAGNIPIYRVVIRSNITSIGDYAFQDGSSLYSLTVEATTPPTLGALALNGTAIYNYQGNIYVPAESVNVYKAASGWSAFADMILPIP